MNELFSLSPLLFLSDCQSQLSLSAVFAIRYCPLSFLPLPCLLLPILTPLLSVEEYKYTQTHTFSAFPLSLSFFPFGPLLSLSLF